MSAGTGAQLSLLLAAPGQSCGPGFDALHNGV